MDAAQAHVLCREGQKAGRGRKLTVSERPARAAVRCAVAARLFLGLAVEMPATRNGAWISALIGGLLAAPWLICLRYARNRAAWPLRLSLVLIALPDAANVLAATVRSAGYLALDRASPALLAVPLGLAMLWSVWRGGDAIGYAGMIWARIALPVLLAVALLQGRYLRPAWLAPVLGSGWPSLITGGVHAAGWIVSAAAVLAVTLVMGMSVNAFAAGGDPITVVNNLSDFIFGLIRAVGLILLGWGIVQVGLSFQSHDPSQRSNGFMTLAGGVIITFAKEILNLIVG